MKKKTTSFLLRKMRNETIICELKVKRSPLVSFFFFSIYIYINNIVRLSRTHEKFTKVRSCSPSVTFELLNLARQKRIKIEKKQKGSSCLREEGKEKKILNKEGRHSLQTYNAN